MINLRSVFGLSLARRRVRRSLLAIYAILILALAVLTALRDADSLVLFHRQLRPLGIAGGIGAALLVFIVTRLALGNLVDFDGTQTTVARTPSRFLNGFIEGFLVFTKKGYLAHIDERDINLRNAAHYDAFRFMRSVVLVVGIVVLCAPVAIYPWLESPLAFLVTLAVMYLPHALILWTEPDMDPGQERIN